MVPMAQSMLALPVKTEACLKTIVDIVFEKVFKSHDLNTLMQTCYL